MTDSEALTAIDQLRLHVHDGSTFEMPDVENLLAEIDALSALGTAPAVGVPSRWTIHAATECDGSPCAYMARSGDGDWVRFSDVVDICAANQELRRASPAPATAAEIGAGKRCDPSKCLRTDGIVCADEECDLESGVISIKQAEAAIRSAPTLDEDGRIIETASAIGAIRALSEGSANGK